MRRARRRCRRGGPAAGISAFLVAGLPWAGAAQEAPPGAGAGYLDELRGEREEGWIRRELLRLRTYPHLDRAYRLTEEERLDEARAELESCLELDPRDLEVRFTYLLLLHRLGDDAEVVRQASGLLEARPALVPALLYRGVAHQRRGEAELAETDFRAAAEEPRATDADRAFALEMWADVALEECRWDAAAVALDRLEALGTESFSLHFRRGLIAQGRGRYAEAGAAFRRALERTGEPPERLRAHRALGEAAGALGDWEAVRNALEAAAGLAPGDPEIARGLAHAAYRQGDHPRAAELMRRVLELEPRPRDREFLANVLIEQGEFEAAAAAYSGALEGLSTPQDRHRVFLALGNARHRLGRFGPAAEAFGQAAGLRRDEEALAGWAQALESAGRAREAIPVYRQLLDRSPGPELHLRLATAYAEAGETGPAIRHLRRAAESALPPERRAAAYRRLGFLEAGRNGHEAARDAFEQALALSPEPDAGLLFALGETCNRLRAFDTAAAYLERGLALEDRPEARRSLAWAHAGAGRPEAAIRVYRRLLETAAPEIPVPEVLVQIANLELERDRPEAAAELLLEASALRETPDPGLLDRASESLILAERWDEALQVSRRLVQLDLPAARRGAVLERQGLLQNRLGHFAEAVESFRGALEAGREGRRLRHSLGFAYFESGRWPEALEQFHLALEIEPSPRSRVYLARCYDRLERPGLALHHLKQILPELERLPTEDRRAVLEEMGYLHFQQAAYEEAARSWRARLELGDDPVVALRYGATLHLLERPEEARAVLSAIAPEALPPAHEARRLDELGKIAAALAEPEAALELHRRAHDTEPSAERQYRLGLSHQALGEPREAVAWLRLAAAAEPDNTRYREALGYAYVAVAAWDEAIAAFESVLTRDPDYLSLYQDLGYLHLRRSDNPRAVDWFRRAIDNQPLYPVHSPAEERALEQEMDRLRLEVAKLDDRVDVTLHLAARSESLPGAAAVAPGGGVLPSQGGLELAFQPPRLGFRNERLLQVFGRVLTDVRPGTLDVDERSYQGGVGLRYKPLRSRNLFLSGERLFEIGEESRDDWLLRALFSWTPGYALRPGERLWNYTFLYLDAGYFFEEPSGWACYGEFRQGFTYNLSGRLLLTPHLVVDGRYEDPGGGTGSYLEAGGGISAKLLLGGGTYRRSDVGLELLVQYRAGRFVNRRAEVRDESFDGFVTTAIFQF